jgi:hypothetical protein
MHRVTVTLADGDRAWLVLRRDVRPDHVTKDSGVAAHEAAVLGLVEPIATPTPRLIAVDAAGGQAGTPAVLMTELAGRPVWAASLRWICQLVEVLVDVQAVDPAAARWLRPFAVYPQESYAVPTWVTKPAVWERAIEIFHGPVLDHDHAFIHRDFYPQQNRPSCLTLTTLGCLCAALSADRFSTKPFSAKGSASACRHSAKSTLLSAYVEHRVSQCAVVQPRFASSPAAPRMSRNRLQRLTVVTRSTGPRRESARRMSPSRDVVELASALARPCASLNLGSVRTAVTAQR